MIRGSLSHVDLTVSDRARSIEFYAEILGRLGFRRLDEFGAGLPCWGVSDAQGSHFSMALKATTSTKDNLRADRSRCGVHHLAFHADSREDVDAFHDFLVQLGATVLDPPAEYDYTPGYYAVFFEDPDGLKLEVVYEPELRGRMPCSDDFDTFFRSYAAAFDAFDADRIARFFHLPCLLVDGRRAVSLEVFEAVRDNMQALVRRHATEGYARAKIEDLEVLTRGEALATTSLGWRVFREDDSVLWSWRNEYMLADYGEGWKILVSTIQEGL